MDQNKDGKISREEWIARYGSDEGFDEYDLDGDGFVDPDEFRKGQAAERKLTAMDTKTGTKRNGKLCLVDLAGSEMIKLAQD